MIHKYKIEKHSIKIEYREESNPTFNSFERVDELLFSVIIEYNYDYEFLKISTSIHDTSCMNILNSFLADCKSITRFKYSRMINLLEAYDFEKITT